MVACSPVKRHWPWLCAVSSGLLLALCYAPANLGGLVWVALVPLIAALWLGEPGRHPARQAFFLGYLSGLLYFLGSFHWLVTVTVPGWVALCLYLALFPAVWAVFMARIRPASGSQKDAWGSAARNLGITALAAAAWTALEWLRGTLFTGFGWNALGVALHENVALVQICDITGVAGLSFVIVMVNAMLVVTAKRLAGEARQGRLRPHYDFSLTIALVALVFGYGVRTLVRPSPAGQPLRIAAVQGNVPISEKRDPAHEASILDLNVRLTETALGIKPDLIVWPEAATPRPLFSDQQTWDTVRGVAERHQGDFLLGTVHYDSSGDFNSAVLLTDNGKLAQFYHKVHLVPFGEYVPLRETFPLFAWIVGDLVPEDFDFGPEPRVLAMHKPAVSLAPLICFEDTLGDLARQFARLGAQLFVTMTNDGWFLRSAGSEQHLANAKFRCVETRLPMIRAANTGVSCVIDDRGRITNRLQSDRGDSFIEGVLFAQVDVPKVPRQTFYTRRGELFAWLCLGAAALGVGWRAARGPV